MATSLIAQHHFWRYKSDLQNRGQIAFCIICLIAFAVILYHLNPKIEKSISLKDYIVSLFPIFWAGWYAVT